MAYTQHDKLISVTTQLGEDVFLLTGLSGEEAISAGFQFELSLLSEQHRIPYETLLGGNLTVSITVPDGGKRCLNGIISSFSKGRSGGEEGEDTRFSYYRCTMVPWFWTLSKSADIRIFQNLSTPEIAEQVFRDFGCAWYKFDLRESYDKREFCVQYRETAFDFISRLLEEEGIFYFFEHEPGKHTMILADAPEATVSCPYQQSASSLAGASGTREEDVITALEITHRTRPSKYVLNDYNFTVPKNSLKSESRAARPTAESEIYDAPGKYDQRAGGDRLARIRIEEEEALTTVLSGSSDCRGFASGYRFIMRDHCNQHLDGKEFLLVSVRHDAVEGYAADCASTYRNTFLCVPYPAPYRPPRLTPKPVVKGAQTAVVVGPEGEEIHTDRYGRVKVRFHWDRREKGKDDTSCWIRVGQPWAGNGWGALYLPRVGQEVIVDFLEGDPDRPIIVGQLFNGLNLPPYRLPDERTKSCIKSSSTPGGEGHNELMFEDKKGEEELYLHAQRRQVNRVREDALEWVGQDRHLIVKRDRLEKISRDQHLQILGDCNERIDGTLSVSVGGDVQVKAAARYALQAGEEIHITTARSAIIESLSKVSLQVGQNFITIDHAGVTIVGNMVLINSGGSPAFASGASPDLPKTPKGDEPTGSEEDGAGKKVPVDPGPQAQALKAAAARGSAVCER